MELIIMCCNMIKYIVIHKKADRLTNLFRQLLVDNSEDAAIFQLKSMLQAFHSEDMSMFLT